MQELEIASVKCESCRRMVPAQQGQAHPCWQAEQDMQALEEAMWGRYQAEEAIEGPATVVQQYDPTGWWRYS